MNRCAFCNAETSQPPHHIVFRSQGGTNHPLNLITLCYDHHYDIHHGTNTERRNQILAICYEQVRQDPSKCWTGKHKPKIINLIENSGADL